MHLRKKGSSSLSGRRLGVDLFIYVVHLILATIKNNILVLSRLPIEAPIQDSRLRWSKRKELLKEAMNPVVEKCNYLSTKMPKLFLRDHVSRS